MVCNIEGVGCIHEVDVRDKETLGWETQYGIEEMCRDCWNWQRNNPEGYPNKRYELSSKYCVMGDYQARFREHLAFLPCKRSEIERAFI